MKLRITTDPHQWVLNEVSTAGPKSKTPGVETVQPVGYYPSLSSALQGGADKLLRSLVPTEGIDLAGAVMDLAALLAKAEKQIEVRS